jgi:hypothetical protein
MGWPYAFGAESRYYGTTVPAAPTAPLACKSVWGMTYPIKEISANQNAIHYIDSLGNLYGMGDNAQGEIGNGQELVNHAEQYATPYAWDWGKNEMMTPAPVQILPGTKFKKLFTGNSFVFYHYVLDVNDSLYFWGRNKSFVGGDGSTNNQEGTWPNAMDILTPTLRTPIGVSPTQTTAYNFTPYTLKGVAQQAITTTTASLSATATPSVLVSSGKPNYGYTITKYHWTKTSGPSGYAITTPDSLNTTVTGLTNGTYVFTIQTTDNNTATISANDTIVVSGLPAASPGAGQRTGSSANMTSDSDQPKDGQRTISLYPNPIATDQQLTIEGRNWKEGALRLRIYDVKGRLVKQATLENTSVYFRQTIPLSGLGRGAYLLSIGSNEGEKPEILKFIIQ